MRQDIIDVLRTSRMDLVRALIGLPPYAVHRWHMAYRKVVSTFAFKLVINTCTCVAFTWKRCVQRANPANGVQLFQAGWLSSALCMPSCSVRA